MIPYPPGGGGQSIASHAGRMNLAGAVLIVAMTLAVYYQLPWHGFVSLDDAAYVTANSRVQEGLSLENVNWALTTRHAEFWHPLTWLSYMLDTEIYGVRAGGYLLTNLVLHVFNSLLVFFFLQKFTGRPWAAFLAASLFAVHPLHVEAVAWVSGRKELLCAFFWLLALPAYGYYTRASLRRRRWQAAVAACFVLGLMAKPMIVTLPFALLLLDYWPLERDRLAPAEKRGIRRWLPLVREKLLLFVLAAAGSMMAMTAQQEGGGVASLSASPWPERMANGLTAYGMYLKKFFWPENLSVVYPVPRPPLPVMIPAAMALLLGLITVVLFRRAGQRRYLSVGWLWFLGTLVPVIGIVKIGDFFMADRYMYIPLLGLLIMLSVGLDEMISAAGRRWRQVVRIAVPVLLIGSFLPLAHNQVSVWQNSHTLYTHALAVNPDDFLAHHALAKLLADKGDMRSAIFHFSRAAHLRPDKAALWVILGRARAAAGQWPEAVNAFARARRQAPEHPAPWFYLSGTAAAQGDFKNGVQRLLRCLEAEERQKGEGVDFSGRVRKYYRQGLAAEKNGRDQKAAECYRRALTIGGLDLSGNGLRRQMAGDYDQWSAERRPQGAVIEDCHPAQD